MTIERNADGLVRAYGSDAGQPTNGTVGSPATRGSDLELVADIDYRDLPAAGASATLDPMYVAALPEGALITDAKLDVTEAFTSGGAATLDLGLVQENGTAVDLDGIDAAIALSAINGVGDRVECDGALVNGAAVSARSFLSASVGTAAYTAGKARLVISYRLV